MDKIYRPSPTGKKFHDARDKTTGFVRGIMGPFGSGKSVTCVMELLLIAMNQEPDRGYEREYRDGIPYYLNKPIRRTRFSVVRNTYRELLDTTINTFFDWIPKESGHFSNLTMTFTLEQDLSDGTVMFAEFLFRALDKPDDIGKVLSLEITAAWINEAREISLAIVEAIQGRCGRYPSVDIHQEATFDGVIMDTNPPDRDHWWHDLFEGHISPKTGEWRPCPSNHILFRQPSGISPEAENLKNLKTGYYTNLMIGKQQEWINVYIHGTYGLVMNGAPVFPEYNDDIHHIPSFTPIPTLPLYVGIDFGLTPAASIGQFTPAGRLVIFDELVTFNMGAVSFGRLLHQRLSTKYRDFTAEVYGDPAGEQRAQTDENTPYMVLAEQGINAYPTYTNDFTIRREVMADLMQRLDFTGSPSFAVTDGAPTLRKALSGGYAMRRMQVSGEERYMDKPDKGRFSHIADSCQYLCLGAVGDARIIGGYDNKAITYDNRGII
jgi:hypothetical protein